MSDYVQVPREPTEEMLEAGFAAYHCHPEYVDRKGLTKAYAAMCAAAPQATDPRDAEIVRSINGETVLGFSVAAYRETGPTRFSTVYSEHWSTPNRKDPNITVERLFTEQQLRAALTTQPSKTETRDDG